MPAAFATASTITPSRAPCRSSPTSRPPRNRCSGSVAVANRRASSSRRAACEPRPAMACRRVNASSTSSTSSVGGASAGGGSSRRDAHPTPIVPCGSSPERYATAIGTSSGARLGEAVGEPGDLRQAGRCGGDVSRCLRDLVEMHSRHSTSSTLDVRSLSFTSHPPPVRSHEHVAQQARSPTGSRGAESER